MRVIYPPKRNSRKRNWPKRLRRWVAGIRQIVETVYDKLFNAFGLWRERPHEMGVCGRVWRRGWRCITSVYGSMTISVGHV